MTLMLVVMMALPALAHRGVSQWWQYDKVVWKKGWAASQHLAVKHHRWHHQHPHYSQYGDTRSDHRHFHVALKRSWRGQHFHRAIGWSRGYATWYRQAGTIGACGVRLRGAYAASRTLPCGSLVSVRHGDRYVFVTIKDRGPFGDHRRIIDLSRGAFRALAPLGAGVIRINAVRLAS